MFLLYLMLKEMDLSGKKSLSTIILFVTNYYRLHCSTTFSVILQEIYMRSDSSNSLTDVQYCCRY